MARVWFSLVCAVLLAGCQSLRETEAFYVPTTGKAFPPLAKDADVPVISEPPAWPHEIIGRFAMKSDRGYKLVYRAMLYNARRQGADAVILRRVAFDDRRTYNYIPPMTDSVPVTRFYYQTIRNSEGQWVTVPQAYTAFVPVFRPGRTVVTDSQWTDLEAEMVVRKNKTAWSPPTPLR